MSQVLCKRCGKEGEGLTTAPYPGALGETILKNTCITCMEEWKKFSVMVINDYKLRPFLPKDRDVLQTHLKEFLNLEGKGATKPQPLTGQGKEVSFEEERVIETLKQVFDPEIPVNIYDLGLIYGVSVKEGRAEIKMTLTSQHCPAAQSLPATVQAVVNRVSGIKEVKVEIVWDPPWTKDKISEEGRRALGI